MYLLICAVNSYLDDISMECKVYMSSSLRPDQYVIIKLHDVGPFQKYISLQMKLFACVYH